MTDKQITIRMPRELLDKWLAALRSGKYQQAKGALTDGVGFCCLGVLVQESGEIAAHMDFGGLPVRDWFERFKVDFDDDGEFSRNAYLPTLHSFASTVNDNGKPFAEIADAIEACSEGY